MPKYRKKKNPLKGESSSPGRQSDMTDRRRGKMVEQEKHADCHEARREGSKGARQSTRSRPDATRWGGERGISFGTRSLPKKRFEFGRMSYISDCRTM